MEIYIFRVLTANSDLIFSLFICNGYYFWQLLSLLLCCIVFWKQPLYLHEVGVRSAYTLPSPDPGMLLLYYYVIEMDLDAQLTKLEMQQASLLGAPRSPAGPK